MTQRQMLLVSRVLKTIAAWLGLLWGGLFILALRFVTRAPTGRSFTGQPTVSWSNHGVIHHVPLSDYTFYSSVMTAAPFVIAASGSAVLLAKWLERRSQSVR